MAQMVRNRFACCADVRVIVPAGRWGCGKLEVAISEAPFLVVVRPVSVLPTPVRVVLFGCPSSIALVALPVNNLMCLILTIECL